MKTIIIVILLGLVLALGSCVYENLPPFPTSASLGG